MYWVSQLDVSYLPNQLRPDPVCNQKYDFKHLHIQWNVTFVVNLTHLNIGAQKNTVFGPKEKKINTDELW